MFCTVRRIKIFAPIIQGLHVINGSFVGIAYNGKDKQCDLIKRVRQHCSVCCIPDILVHLDVHVVEPAVSRFLLTRLLGFGVAHAQAMQHFVFHFDGDVNWQNAQ